MSKKEAWNRAGELLLQVGIPDALDYSLLSVLLLVELKKLKDEIDALKVQIGG